MAGSSMSMTTPARALQSYRHEAFLWHDRADFVEGLVPFVRGGLESGEAVMVAVTPEHAGWLADELGPRMREVQLVDMLELGSNPARIIPAWQEFLDSWCGLRRPARGVGEPLWVGRGQDEVLEAQLHEILLNLAVDPDLPFWLVCPYDASGLGEDILDEAARSHPAIATATSYEGSRSYRGHDHAQALFSAELPPLGTPTDELRVTELNLFAVVEALTLRAASAGLWSHKVLSLSDAVRLLAAASLRRGARTVDVRTWVQPDVLVCEVAASLVIDDFLVGRRPASPAERDAWWYANQCCDLVQVRSGHAGTTVRLHMRT